MLLCNSYVNIDGVIRNSDLSNVLQSLGQIKPSDIELADMINEIESYRNKATSDNISNELCNTTSNNNPTNVNKGHIEYHDLLALVARKLKDSQAEEEIKYAFSVYVTV